MPRTSDMSLGSQDASIDDSTSLDQSLFETLNNINYRTVLGHVISLAVSDVRNTFLFKSGSLELPFRLIQIFYFLFLHIVDLDFLSYRVF